MSFDLGVLVLHKEKMVGTALPNLADSATYRGSGKTNWWRNTDYELLKYQKPVLELDI
jgi:hypothetical protein